MAAEKDKITKSTTISIPMATVGGLILIAASWLFSTQNASIRKLDQALIEIKFLREDVDEIKKGDKIRTPADVWGAMRGKS